MNARSYDVLDTIIEESLTNQRKIAITSGYSLGTVNQSIKKLKQKGYIDDNLHPTSKTMAEAKEKSPDKAIILAAGFGMRMVPLNTEIPKGLLEVHGERLIDRLILQLISAGIKEVAVVVGFMKEKYEYLIDKYGVKLIVNPSYATTNNLHSMKLASDSLTNTYIMPCDIWCESNPFRKREWYSWYMITDREDEDSLFRVNRKRELVKIKGDEIGNAMIGICYLLERQASQVKNRIQSMTADSKYDNVFWEEALVEDNRLIVYAKTVKLTEAIEINTVEQLRELDSSSKQLQSEVFDIIASVLKTQPSKITDIQVLKKGMTNRSFLFSFDGQRYIMRIPGEGTDNLINREQEAAVYHCVSGHVPTDEVLFIDPSNGYKITRFHEDSRVCDPLNPEDVSRCMKVLRDFHESKLTVPHTFDIIERLEFYESLWNGGVSIYDDYPRVKENAYSLLPYTQKHAMPFVLSHIDPVPDNFLFVQDNTRKESIRLLDWEYASMQDPHVDIAMFGIYSLYDKKQMDHLIDAYFMDSCKPEVRIKIYCYIALCGLLWSNWCEYKRELGVDFGEYSLRQYRYAKDYYQIAKAAVEDIEVSN